MEKERCWQTIQNNRLYSELKKTVMLNKPNIDDDDLERALGRKEEEESETTSVKGD